MGAWQGWWGFIEWHDLQLQFKTKKPENGRLDDFSQRTLLTLKAMLRSYKVELEFPMMMLELVCGQNRCWCNWRVKRKAETWPNLHTKLGSCSENIWISQEGCKEICKMLWTQYCLWTWVGQGMGQCLKVLGKDPHLSWSWWTSRYTNIPLFLKCFKHFSAFNTFSALSWRIISREKLAEMIPVNPPAINQHCKRGRSCQNHKAKECFPRTLSKTFRHLQTQLW